MNANAVNRKSSIRIRKTSCGKLPDSMGFSKTDGRTVDKELYYISLEMRGYIVERTPHGVIITNPNNFNQNPNENSNKRTLREFLLGLFK